MSKNPINLGMRFLLELVALVAIGYWGWTQHSGLLQPLLGIGLPILAAAIWGTFRVPDDPREPPVTVPGWVRLLLEIAYFGGAVIGLAAANQSTAALILGIVIVAHYVLSYDRIIWLLTER